MSVLTVDKKSIVKQASQLGRITVDIEIDNTSTKPYYLKFNFEGEPGLFKRLVNIAKEKGLCLLRKKPLFLTPYWILHCPTQRELYSLTTDLYQLEYLLQDDYKDEIRFEKIKDAESSRLDINNLLKPFVESESGKFFLLLQEGKMFYPTTLPAADYFKSKRDKNLEDRLSRILEEILIDNNEENEYLFQKLASYFINQSYIFLCSLSEERRSGRINEDLYIHLVHEIAYEFDDLPGSFNSESIMDIVLRPVLIARTITTLLTAYKIMSMSNRMSHQHEIVIQKAIELIPDLAEALKSHESN